MKNNFISILFIIFALSSFGCQPNSAILNSQKSDDKPTTISNDENAERPQDEFEFALKRMQKSGFTQIFVMRRSDGGTIDKEDGRYIKENSPPGTNQFVLTDKDRAVIAGSNFPFTPENLEMLREKFSVEDFSPKDENATPETNVNQ